MRRINLLRKFLPDREAIACQGYGHRLWMDDLPIDNTQKTGIPRSLLPPLWLTSVNSIFRGIAERRFRPATWLEYAEMVVTLRRAVLDGLQHLERALDDYFRKRTFIHVHDKVTTEAQWSVCRTMLVKPPLLPSCAVDEWGFVDEFGSLRIGTESETRFAHASKTGLVIKEYKPFLTNFDDYRRALSNFFSQAIHPMILNPILGRQAKTREGKEKALQAAFAAGISPDAGRLATSNLSDAIKKLATMQREYRCLLGHFHDNDKLDKLDHHEQRVFKRVWDKWCSFAFHPSRVLPNPTQDTARLIRDLLKRIRNDLRQELSTRSSDMLRFDLLPEVVPWDDQPALSLTIDGRYPADVYSSVEGALEAISQVISRDIDDDLQRFVLNFFWSVVVIVPLVRGRSLTNTAWHISLPLILKEDERGQLSWIHFIPAQIPADALTRLELSVWTLPGLDDAAKLYESTSALSLMAAHIRDFRRLPDLDDEAIDYLQTYIQDCEDELRRARHQAEASASQMLHAYQQLAPSEHERRSNLVAAIGALARWHDAILLDSHDPGETKLAFAEFIEWANRLEEAREHAFTAYLYWSADILDEAAT